MGARSEDIRPRGKGYLGPAAWNEQHVTWSKVINALRFCLRRAENVNDIFANNIMELNRNLKFPKNLIEHCTFSCYI